MKQFRSSLQLIQLKAQASNTLHVAVLQQQIAWKTLFLYNNEIHFVCADAREAFKNSRPFTSTWSHVFVIERNSCESDRAEKDVTKEDADVNSHQKQTLMKHVAPKFARIGLIAVCR